MPTRVAGTVSQVVRTSAVVSALALGVAALSAPAGSAAVPHTRPATASSGTTAITGTPGGDPSFSWEILPTDSSGDFGGLDVVSEDVAWASSGDTSEVLRTVDGGATFENVTPPDAVPEDLILTDVEAASADEAILLASGVGGLSRVYRTTDGGTTWTETFRATDPRAFFDCIAMFDPNRGFAFGDPVDGRYQVIRTDDGGASWVYVPEEASPSAGEGEFGLAGSGNCATATAKTGWFGTGGGFGPAKVFRTSDYGASWALAVTPIPGEQYGAIAGLDFRTNRLGPSPAVSWCVSRSGLPSWDTSC